MARIQVKFMWRLYKTTPLIRKQTWKIHQDYSDTFLDNVLHIVCDESLQWETTQNRAYAISYRRYGFFVYGNQVLSMSKMRGKNPGKLDVVRNLTHQLQIMVFTWILPYSLHNPWQYYTMYLLSLQLLVYKHARKKRFTHTHKKTSKHTWRVQCSFNSGWKFSCAYDLCRSHSLQWVLGHETVCKSDVSHWAIWILHTYLQQKWRNTHTLACELCAGSHKWA